MGYDGVELAVRDPALVDTNELISVVNRHCLEVPMIGTGQAWVEEGLSFTDPDPRVREAAIQRIYSHVPLAAKLNAMIMLGLIRGRIARGTTLARAMDLLVDALRTCAEVGARHGVRYVVEPINRYDSDFIHSTQDGLALLDRVGCDNVGLILDTFHMNIEDVSLKASFRECGDRLFHVHLSDSNRWYPGGGHIDFAEVVQCLREIGYRDYLSGEFMAVPDPLTAARRAIDHVRPLICAAEVEEGRSTVS